jgi:threonine synthase
MKTTERKPIGSAKSDDAEVDDAEVDAAEVDAAEVDAAEVDAADSNAAVALKCLSCGTRHGVLDGAVACRQCAGLLDIDIDASRLPRALTPRRRGTWAYHRWFAPAVQDEDIVTLGEGAGPLVDLEVSGQRIWLKQCGQQPTGSFKDLGMTALVSYVRARRRRGARIDALVCASTGDTSAALAAYGARAQIPVAVLLPAGKVSLAQLVQPVAHGARVIAIDGDFDTCMKVVVDVADSEGVVLANSMNPLRLLGQMTVAFEIVDDLAHQGAPPPDVVMVPSGNLGNVSAIARGFELLVGLGKLQRVPRLVACQVNAANPLYRAFAAHLLPTVEPMTATETHATAIRIGAPVSAPRAARALAATKGWVTTTDEAGLLDAMARADRQGHLVCPQTAAALAGLRHSLQQGQVAPSDTVVVVGTASGLKFVEQKQAFHQGTTSLGDLPLSPSTSMLRNPISRCAPRAADVWKAIGALA